MHRLWTIAFCYYCVAFVVAETIHFTNSPGHLVGSKNFTTYKLHVKNAEPITIIEASKEVSLPSDTDDRPLSSTEFMYNQNDRMDYEINDDDRNVFLNKKLVASIGASHQAETQKTHEIHESLGLVVDANPDESATAAATRNEYKVNGGDVVSGVGIKKLVYSPVLLKKFVKEYTEKLKNADVGTKNAIIAIGEKLGGNTTTTTNHRNDNDNAGNKNGNGGVDEAEQKYNYNSFHDSYDSHRNRRPGASGNNNNAYKDRDGWVTLEAVPWSSSSVSKWYAYGNKNKDDRRRPSSGGYGSSFDRPYGSSSRPDKFPYDDVDDDERYYNRPRPGQIDRDSRPNVYSTWTKPQPMGRPPRPQYNYGDSGMFNSGGDKFFDRPSSISHTGGRPWGDDIITDNGPSNFPGSGGGGGSSSGAGYYSTKHQNDDFDESDDGDHYRPSGSSIHNSYQSRPNEGNGEWVLISTTKGYQIPGGHRQHGKRAMSLSQSGVTQNAPSIVAHKAVKLTVLPALAPNPNNFNKSSAFSTDNHKPSIITSHGGLLEVGGNDQTVDEHVKATIHTLADTGAMKPATKPQKNVVKRRKVVKGNNQ